METELKLWSFADFTAKEESAVNGWLIPHQSLFKLADRFWIDSLWVDDEYDWTWVAIGKTESFSKCNHLHFRIAVHVLADQDIANK